MNARETVRMHYVAKALMWGAVAMTCAIPALPYLRAFAEFVREGLNGRF
jgi:hypothetical protein